MISFIVFKALVHVDLRVPKLADLVHNIINYERFKTDIRVTNNEFLVEVLHYLFLFLEFLELVYSVPDA